MLDLLYGDSIVSEPIGIFIIIHLSIVIENLKKHCVKNVHEQITVENIDIIIIIIFFFLSFHVEGQLKYSSNIY